MNTSNGEGKKQRKKPEDTTRNEQEDTTRKEQEDTNRKEQEQEISAKINDVTTFREKAIKTRVISGASNPKGSYRSTGNLLENNKDSRYRWVNPKRLIQASKINPFDR